MAKRRSKHDVLRDEFSAHEALDRTHVAATIFYEFVQTHPFIEAHPKLRAAAERIGDRLGDFYQLVGRTRFELGGAEASRVAKRRRRK